MDIVTAHSAELRARLGAVLTLAFADDPINRWTFPTAAAFLDGWPRMIDEFARDSVPGQTAWIAGDDDLGAIVWLPPGSGVDSDAIGTIIREYLPAHLLGEAGDFMARLAEFHPHTEHWYLPMLGVDPAHRGRGIGSALLAETLARVDADHADAYLTSSNPRNVTLYLRHGFEVLGEVQVGSSPVMTPMLRPAR